MKLGTTPDGPEYNYDIISIILLKIKFEWIDY